MKNICNDLEAEYNDLDAIVADLNDAEWDMVTPFDGWTIKDEISHIAYYDEAARISVTDSDAFAENMAKMLEGITDADSLFRKQNEIGRKMSSGDLLSWWRKERMALIEAYRSCGPKDRLPWYGPTMSAKSSATARLMETWAHGQDIFDALKINRTGTDRLKHVAHIGVSTFGWTFMCREMDVPAVSVRVELDSPSGDTWTWGAENTEHSVKGDALDFCLVVTQRRNIADTKLVCIGDIAKKWMTLAQAFAGPAEDAPAKGERIF